MHLSSLKTSVNIYIQKTSKNLGEIPSTYHLKKWAQFVLNHLKILSAEITIRIVDKTEIQYLNKRYRHKNKPTNVLAFSYSSLHADLPVSLIGDIVICAEVAQEEALAQKKNPPAHWAHLVIHGILHIVGYDHEKIKEAERMECLEIALMKQLKFLNPYENNEI